MHVLVVYCHPVETSFASALHQEVLKNLRAAGHTVDDCDPAHVKPMLTHIKRIAAVVTYGRPRWLAWYMGDPPRKLVTRYLRRLTANTASVDFHACYHMNVATEPRLARFLRQVGQAMAKFA